MNCETSDEDSCGGASESTSLMSTQVEPGTTDHDVGLSQQTTDQVTHIQVISRPSSSSIRCLSVQAQEPCMHYTVAAPVKSQRGHCAVTVPILILPIPSRVAITPIYYLSYYKSSMFKTFHK